MRLTKKMFIEILAGIKDEGQRRRLIRDLVARGELSEFDLAALIVAEVERNPGYYAEVFRTDEFLKFLMARFGDSPEYLARALVKARSDLFWHFGFAWRIVLRLRAELGTVYMPPGRPGEGPQPRAPLQGLDELLRRDILALDVEHKTRLYLYFFSRDAKRARSFLEDEITSADEYGRDVLVGVRETFDRLEAMRFAGVVHSIRGRLFPAMHVRWWIDRAREMPRVLNIGDTATYKTSFGFVGLDHFGAKRVLVLCAANARRNHAREAAKYFENGASRVQLCEGIGDLETFVAGFDRHQFHIVGWPALIHDRVVEALASLPFDAMFVDECQYGKSVLGKDAAARALGMLRIGRNSALKRVLACSATPWENRPEELAAVAALVRPDLFATPEVFAASGLADTPRVLRELFATSVLDVELREVRDLPGIEPKPWEDLFGAVRVPMHRDHRRVYTTLLRDGSRRRKHAEKIRVLTQASLHPALVRNGYPWPADLAARFDDWQLSSKLVWLKHFIDECIGHAKIAIGTGMYVAGITRPRDGDEELPWIGKLLQEWYGKDRVIILDGKVLLGPNREAVIERWQCDPNVRVLLFSMLTCPDTVNLSVRGGAGLDELWVLAYGLPWKPWKQVLGRFHREELELPIRHRTAVLEDTIEDDLLRFNQDKWRVIQLFRASVPLTEAEWEILGGGRGRKRLRDILRTPIETVNLIGTAMQGRGELVCMELLEKPYGASSQGEAYARHFLAVEEGSTADTVARFMSKHIRALLELEMLTPESLCDCGCGLLRLERTLGIPCFGFDMNPHMIELGQKHSPHGGRNVSLARLSELPSDWKGKFFLSVASLMLDWTSLAAQVGGVPERVHALRELVRITHPQGHIWLTFTGDLLDEELATAWCGVFRQNGFVVDPHLTGRVVTTDGPSKSKTKFWSILVTPDSHTLRTVDPNALMLSFEIGRTVVVKRHRPQSVAAPPGRSGIIHEKFVVEPLGSSRELVDTEAVEQSIESEIRRWVQVVNGGREVGRRARIARGRFAELNWRVLERLVALGILSVR